VPVTITVDGKKLQTMQVEQGVISFPTDSSNVYRVVPN